MRVSVVRRSHVTVLLLALLFVAPGIAASAPSAPEVDLASPVALDDGPVYPYHTWETLTLSLQALVAEHPEVARLHSAGKSHLGFDLWVIEIADFDNPHRVPLDAREVVWLDGGTHANEQLGMMLAWLWAEFLVKEAASNETAEWIVANRHTWIMPMVNPDGNHMNSRWNANLVNINRNYPVGWGKVDERIVGNYPGPYAMSEPETRAVVDFVKRVEPDYFNSFHTGVHMMLYPMGSTDELPLDNVVYERICHELGETDPSFCGPIWSTIYPASGSAVDFAYIETGAISWTYEVSEEGFLYWSFEDPRVRMSRYWVGVEHAFLNVHKYGAHLEILGLDVLDADPANLVLDLVVGNTGYADLPYGTIEVRMNGDNFVELFIMGLKSGESRTLRVALPGTVEASDLEVMGFADHGLFAITFDYAKRLQAQPKTRITEAMLYTVDGNGRIVIVGDLVSTSSGSGPSLFDLPGPGAFLAAFVGLGAAVGLRRRFG